ncbi:MAG: hypothetical protein HUJ98_11490, partial [Bacteroidaceae bacterium]|nr:hypothetical protein [Bacteroidaceae bacterium]
MEKTKGIKAYDEYKTNMRAVADGVNLLGRHAWMLLKACLPLMVMLSLLWGWAAFCLVNDMNQLVTTDITVTGVPHSFFLPFALLSLVKIVALAQFYSLFQGYVRHGFIPQVNYRSIWVQTGKTLKSNTLIVWLWMAFVVGIFFALAYFLMALSPYTLVLTVPAGVLLALWHMNLLTDFHVHEGTLVRSLVRSLKMTMRGFLSFLLVAVLLLIVVA